MSVSSRQVGRGALVAAAWLVIGNLTHPVGSDEIYVDGVAFIQKTDTNWVLNHMLLALALTVVPWLVWAWWKRLTKPRAMTWGAYALILSVAATFSSVFHLAGIDGVALPAYGAILESGGEVAAIGADVLLKVHLASTTAWSILYWGGTQTAIGAVEVMEGERKWLGWLLILCGSLGFLFAGAVAIEGNLTSFTEGVFLRGSTVGLTVWFIWTAWVLARVDESEEGAVART